MSFLLKLLCIFMLLSLNYSDYNSLYMVCNLHESRNHWGKVRQMYKTTVALFSLWFCQDIQASDENYIIYRWKHKISLQDPFFSLFITSSPLISYFFLSQILQVFPCFCCCLCFKTFGLYCTNHRRLLRGLYLVKS